VSPIRVEVAGTQVRCQVSTPPRVGVAGIPGWPSFDVLDAAVLSRPSSQSARLSDGLGCCRGGRPNPCDTASMSTQPRFKATPIGWPPVSPRPGCWLGGSLPAKNVFDRGHGRDTKTDPAGIRTLPRMPLHQPQKVPYHGFERVARLARRILNSHWTRRTRRRRVKYDWDNDWIFTESSAAGERTRRPDDLLLESSLSQMVDPVVSARRGQGRRDCGDPQRAAST
jgi:hypothetical protein